MLPEGRYIVTFVGNSNGVIQCDSVQHLHSVIQDTFGPMSLDTVAEILNPACWVENPTDGLPFYYHMEYAGDYFDQYDLRIYRVIDLSS